jgi:GntR family transcriptional repressor for pyruvate dehydrogenase complex
MPTVRSATEEVELQITELIRSGRLSAGDRLPPERVFAARLGVSRTTLRQSLRALADQGVLDARQGSAWVVRPDASVVASNLAVYFRLEGLSYDQLTEARIVIEPGVARLAAARRTDAQLVALERSVEAMTGDPETEAFLEADSDLHGILAAASQNVAFVVLIAPALSLLHELRTEIVDRDRRVVELVRRDHERIFEAVRDGDGDRAEHAMRTHLEDALLRRDAALGL